MHQEQECPTTNGRAHLYRLPTINLLKILMAVSVDASEASSGRQQT